MKQPNDKKRPNTKGSEEDKERRRNFRYVHVSNPLLEFRNPITGLVQTVVRTPGSTYKKNKENERTQDRSGNPQGS